MTKSISHAIFKKEKVDEREKRGTEWENESTVPHQNGPLVVLGDSE